MPTGVETEVRKKVLIIDDDPTVVGVMEQVLGMAHYGTVSAGVYSEAVDALEFEAPDLLLLDLAMPQVNGRALLEYIRQAGYDVPVIVVSGFLNDSVAQELTQLDVSAFIWKPFDVSDLRDAVGRAIGERNVGPDRRTPEADGETPGARRYLSPRRPLLPVMGTNRDSGPDERIIVNADGRRIRVRRKRVRPRSPKRRTLFYMGMVTLVSVMVALGMNVALSYMKEMDSESAKERAVESLKKQIVDELRKEQLLKELKAETTKN